MERFRLSAGWRLLPALFGVGIVAFGPLGCAGTGGKGSGRDWGGLDAADQSVRDAKKESPAPATGSAGNRPAALIGNETVTWADLNASLAEAAGAAVLEEVALDRLIARELRVRGMSVDDADVERERELLVSTLSVAGLMPSDQQGDVVQRLRRSRGLGEHRFGSLLRRNAMLRRLVRDDVTVSQQDIEQAYEIRYGQKFQTRIILVPTEREAAEALGRVRNGERFTDVATSMSLDASRLRGGYIGAISPADPSFPLALRKAIATGAPGTPSPVIATEQGYAVVLAEQVVPPTGEPLASVAGNLEREVRLIRERAAMDRLAAQLLRATKITVMDPSLDWSWQGRTQE